MKYKKKEAVTISQCMIVKNEEKNIRKALSWGKGLMLEQIVVDTGSTDNTVKIAESMGAKVYSYTWEDDFSAAKNYAVSLAKGRWIAFLDADEFFTAEDTSRLYQYLILLESKRDTVPLPDVIRTAIANLNDEGATVSLSVQDRIFRNIRSLQYFGAIHETLKNRDGASLKLWDLSQKLTVFHTGYSSSAYTETGKLNRNIELLLKALEKEPENKNLMGYLCDSLAAAGRDEEALNWGRKTIETDGPVDPARMILTGHSILKLLIPKTGEERDALFLKTYSICIETEASNPDSDYFMGLYQFQKKDWEQAILSFEQCLQKADSYGGRAGSMCAGLLSDIYNYLVTAHQELSRPAGVVRYGTLSLRSSRYQEVILLAVLQLLRDDPAEKDTAAGTVSWLSKLYDLNSPRDLLFIFKCAKRLGFQPLQKVIFALLPEEDQKAVSAKTGVEIGDSYRALAAAYPGIKVSNETDVSFLTLMNQIGSLTLCELISSMKKSLDVLSNDRAAYQVFVGYFDRYHFWGALKPEEQIFEVLENRAASLKEHRDDYLWLYGRLADYRSKRVLYAILANWFELDLKHLAQVKEPYVDYFDTDIFPDNHDDVLADVGAYIGDTVKAYVETYGADYKRIYCYEVTPETTELLERNTASLENIEIRQKAVSDGPGFITLDANSQDASANRTDGRIGGGGISDVSTDGGSDGGADGCTNGSADGGSEQIKVETVTLDDDISEPLTFIKMDIEGMEQAALRGCENQIRANHPKLAICTYHNYEDIWKIPRMIDAMDPSYQFYMRHYGGNLIPTEFVLLAK